MSVPWDVQEAASIQGVQTMPLNLRLLKTRSAAQIARP